MPLAYCNCGMNADEECGFHYVQYGDKIYEKDRYCFDGEECHDCGAPQINNLAYHHICCDVERCPKCGDQFLGCGCFMNNCDDSCEEMCDKDHAGRTYKTLPKGKTVVNNL